jgi:SsrA-binding protein
MNNKTIAQNKKARFNYFIEDEVEAGIILMGSEVKSIRSGKVNINDAHCAEISGSIYLVNAYISEYKGAVIFNHRPRQNRQLLLHNKQIKKIIGKLKTKGLALIPLSIYLNKRNIVKVKIALGKGKKLHDKRSSIKEKDQNRQAQRDILNN